MTPDPTVTVVSAATLYNNRGYLVTTSDYTRCIHGVQLVPRGHADYRACEKCFALVNGQHAHATEFARSALADVGECEALVEELRNDFINIVVGGCTCGTKPPDPALHELNCHYRMAEAGLARIEAYRTGKQPRPAAEAVCTHCMFTPSERARPDHYRVRPCRYCSPAAHTAQVTARLSSAPWRVVKGKENVGHGWPVAFMGCDHNGDNWYIETHGVHASEAVSEPENDAKAIVAWRNSLAEQGSPKP